MGLKDDASLTTAVNGGVASSWAPDGWNSVKNAGNYVWKYFGENDSTETTLDFIVVDGARPKRASHTRVADQLKALMTEHRMPGEAKVGTKDYDYDYTGHVASIKLDNLRGDESFYVVAVEITKDPD